MGRPVFPFELNDPDFLWLIQNFNENNPDYTCVENSGVPISFIQDEKQFPHEEIADTEVSEEIPVGQLADAADLDEEEWSETN